ncbi:MULTISPECIES: Ger(x)C family spore germination protein [Brevibacillus]|uniref:Germination protein GerYC n=1 Tax=Brevibacillus parabrevis TaxID=54914 RepID=A0A4Y3PJZ3_BREPA|nr:MULTISPECIES: Ger(x)C family spore germination protein [Brevibacillus]MBU8711851.1 Ger(x)C family spore germination protein [Brevibacillus parabrevis]MDH6348921.1 Ger(x)C family germination protein [Brevibacillus sp. 1238]MDR5000938.1 Ger(x)C family spore germination protein [Brevibacillus parabrevis]RNB93511.1 Ger(x)C family spore germination protein [Brevibacillus parabrevis]UED71172.1 Ger(x)C family spore germination protein [Brevibacillus sp. HD3.3A]
MKHVWMWLAVLFLFTGCGFKDIDKRYLVMAVGVDKSELKDKPYRVSLKLAIPTAQIRPGQSNTFHLISDDAPTITEAVRHLKSKVDKDLDFSQTKILVFGTKLAEERLDKTTIDWFLRKPEIQGIAFMALGSPTAEQVLGVRPKSERMPADSLMLSFDQEGTESSFIVTAFLFDFHRRLSEKGLDPYMPVIRPLKDTYLIDQVAVFDKEKIKAVLSPEETRIFNELSKKISNFDIETRTEQARFALNVTSFRYSYEFDERNEAEPKLKMNVHIRGLSEESNQSFYNSNWDRYKAEAEKEAAKRYAHVLRKLQSLKVDPIGFGLRYRATHYQRDQDWEKWLSIYPRLDWNIKVNIDLLGSGGIK